MKYQNMRQEIYKGIVVPLEGYLNGHLSEKEIDWSELRWFVRTHRREDGFMEVREVLNPYYHKLLMAGRGFFHNGNTDSQAKKSLLKLLFEMRKKLRIIEMHEDN